MIGRYIDLWNCLTNWRVFKGCKKVQITYDGADMKVEHIGYRILNQIEPHSTNWPWEHITKTKIPYKVSCFTLSPGF